MTTPVYRSSMADLISYTRRRIGDNGTSQQFTDLEIMIRLDETRLDVKYEELTYPPDLQYNGTSTTVAWDQFYSAFQFWETDWVLQDGHFNNINNLVLTSDELTGRWTFTSTPPGQLPPVFATGKSYDCYSAAAELLDEWIAALAGTTFDVTTGGNSMRLSQIMTFKQDMAAQFRAKARPRIVSMTRDDLNYSHQHSPQRLTLVGNPNAEY